MSGYSLLPVPRQRDYMDVLTHLFLPITIAYAIRPDLFPSPWYFALAGFAVLPDFDKVLGISGLLHSIFVVGGIGIALTISERRLSDTETYATIATLLLASHLLLDFLDGGPVTLFYPFIKTGVGLEYPTKIVFGDAVHDVTIRNPIPQIQAGTTDVSREAYPLVNGYGVLSVFAFLTVYLGNEIQRRNEG